MPFLTLLLPILGSIFSNGKGGILDIIGNYFNKQGELAQAKLDLERQVIISQQQYASDYAKSIIPATGSKFKYFSFFMWFGPYILQLIYPPGAAYIFNNLSLMPEWYAQSCVVIMFAVWGISVSGPIVNNIFSSLGAYMSDRRQDLIAKAAVDKKAYYDALRTVKGVVTDSDVALNDKVLDILNKQQGD